MRITKTISGFCPTQNKEYNIDVTYEGNISFGGQAEYVRVCADCDYLSYDFSRCPIHKECPLKAKAPKKLSCD